MTLRSNAHEENKDLFVTCTDLWPDERYIKDKFFEPSKTETETALLMFDIPHIHNPNRPESNLVAKALSEVDVDDSDLLRSKTVRSIITFRW